MNYPDILMQAVKDDRADGLSWKEIGAKHDLHEEQIRSGFRRWKQRNKMTMWDGVIQEGVAPFKLDLALPEVTVRDLIKKRSFTQLIFSDAHVPYFCPASLSILLQVIEEYQPDSLVNLGDHNDAYALSDFMKDPNRKETFQDEVNMGRGYHLKVREAAPKATYDIFEGNHEERLRRTLWRAAKTQAILFELTNLQRELTWPQLLDLDGLGATWHPTGSVVEIAPDFYAHHGDCGGDPFTKFGVSGISGHIHKFKLQSRRTIKEQLEWFTCPTMGTLNPEYDCHPQWQNGFWFFTHSDGERYAEQVRINDGRALFRGKTYTA